MTTLTRPVASSPTSSTKKTLRVAAAALLGAAAIIAALAVISSRSDDSGPPKQELRSQAFGFSLLYGKGWAPVPASVLAQTPSKPAAMLRRGDGRALVTVRPAAAHTSDPRALATDMRRELARRFPDFRAVSARVVPLESGRAFLFTFVRTRSRTVQTIALAAIGKRGFRLEGVVSGDAPQAARETADILSSFGP